MLEYSWVVILDGEKHHVRVTYPSVVLESWGRKIYFDQEVVKANTVYFAASVDFAFERGGHEFQLSGIGMLFTYPNPMLLVDGIAVRQDTPTVIPPSSADSTVSEPDNTDSSVANPTSGDELVSEDNVHENTEVIATEEYPLDNRAGAESVTIEHEISRTASNEMSVGNASQKDGGISIELLNLIKGDLSAKLVKQTGQTLGETVTRRHSIRFSAGPHQAVTYVVVWKRRIRTGNYLVLSNGTYTTIPYTAYFDLTFEVQSR